MNKEAPKERDLRKLADDGTLFEEKEVAEPAESSQYIQCEARYGHLYNLATGKRVVFDDDTLFELKGEYIPPKNESILPQSVDALKNEVSAKGENYFQAFERGTKLYFILKSPHSYFFTFELLEELYVKNTATGYSLYKCKCKTIYSDIPFFEVIHGVSLSELYRKTSILYNGSKRSPEVQVASEYFFTKPIRDKNFALKEEFKRIERLIEAKAKAKEQIKELEKLKI